MLHLLLLFFLAFLIDPELIGIYDEMEFNKILIVILGIILVSKVASIIVKLLISRWSPSTEDKEEDSLIMAGSMIGMLERLFVFCFIIFGQFQAVGFLLAAKSVFRFVDLKESKDRKLTEYILIGTLISFGIAIIIGVVVQYFLQHSQLLEL